LLWELGDADLSAIRNGGDVTEINKILKGTSNPLNGITGATRNLLYYRIFDVDRSKIFNGGDATAVTKILKGTLQGSPIYTELN
jgi:hypothetical protein